MSPPIVYLIRHGEKPPKVNDEDPPGLSTNGTTRSQELIKVFDHSSPYKIGLIIAQAPKGEVTGTAEDEKLGQARPYLTVAPLAKSLGDKVEFDYTIKRDHADKVAKAVHHYKGKGNILVCWEHHHLTDIATALGIPGNPTYPDDRFDLIWTVDSPYNQINDVTSEHCQGLDDKWKDDKWADINGVWTNGTETLQPKPEEETS